MALKMGQWPETGVLLINESKPKMLKCWPVKSLKSLSLFLIHYIYVFIQSPPNLIASGICNFQVITGHGPSTTLQLFPVSRYIPVHKSSHILPRIYKILVSKDFAVQDTASYYAIQNPLCVVATF